MSVRPTVRNGIGETCISRSVGHAKDQSWIFKCVAVAVAVFVAVTIASAANKTWILKDFYLKHLKI